MITRENYEIYFVDYLDNNLSADLKVELINFLKANNDLQAELQLVANFSLPESDCQYSSKSLLYKSELDDCKAFNETAISILESDATPKQSEQFEQYLETHPNKSHDFELFRKVSNLQAPNISYPNKSQLYKRVIPLVWWQRAASIAAVLLLFISISYFFNEHTSRVTETTQPIATNHSNLPKEQPQQTIAPVIKNKVIDKVEVQPQEENLAKPKQPIKRKTYQALKKLKSIPPTLLAQTNDITIETLRKTQYPKTELQPHIYAHLNALKTTVVDNGITKAVQPDKIKKTFWKTMAAVSGERLIIYEDTKGKIRKISYDSDFLAFSIPLNNQQ